MTNRNPNKKWLSLLLAAALTAGLATGCTQQPASEAQAGAPTSTVSESEAQAQPDAESTADTESAGGADAAGDEQPAGGIYIKDMAGRELTLDAPAERVVALMPADCEILFSDALDAGHTLVGRGEYCDWPAAVLDVPAVQSGGAMNIEEILALEPDAVIMSVMGQTLEQVEALENAGVLVVISDAQDLEGVYEAISLLGSVVGREEQAQALIMDMVKRFAEIENQVFTATLEAETKPTVYFEASPLEYGLWTAGAGTFMDEIATMLGLENIFADVDGWAEISQEQVIQRNPDYIITTTMYFGEGPLPVDEVLARAGWEDISAVANGRVYQADSDQITRPGPRLAEAAEELYTFLYGT